MGKGNIEWGTLSKQCVLQISIYGLYKDAIFVDEQLLYWFECQLVLLVFMFNFWKHFLSY